MISTIFHQSPLQKLLVKIAKQAYVTFCAYACMYVRCTKYRSYANSRKNDAKVQGAISNVCKIDKDRAKVQCRSIVITIRGHRRALIMHHACIYYLLSDESISLRIASHSFKGLTSSRDKPLCLRPLISIVFARRSVTPPASNCVGNSIAAKLSRHYSREPYSAGEYTRQPRSNSCIVDLDRWLCPRPSCPVPSSLLTYLSQLVLIYNWYNKKYIGINWSVVNKKIFFSTVTEIGSLKISLNFRAVCSFVNKLLDPLHFRGVYLVELFTVNKVTRFVILITPTTSN